MEQALETTTFAVLFVVAAYFYLVNQKYRNFKRYLKPDDPIRFYIGEEKYYGRVKSIGTKYVHIDTLNMKGTPIVRKIEFKNTYPVFWFRYKPEFD